MFDLKTTAIRRKVSELHQLEIKQHLSSIHFSFSHTTCMKPTIQGMDKGYGNSRSQFGQSQLSIFFNEK
jgi:hypothetical protein